MYLSSTQEKCPNTMFDHFGQKYAEEMATDWRHPKLLQMWNRFAWNKQRRDVQALFYAGPIGSGTSVHAHNAAFNALVYGAKRWYSRYG